MDTQDDLLSYSIAPTWLINQSRSADSYTVWQVDWASPELFVQHTMPASFPRSTHLSTPGGYVLAYTPPDPANSLAVGWSLLRFDPSSSDPLHAGVVSSGTWEGSKFQGFYDHYLWEGESTDIVQLLPTTDYVLQFMPASTRGTYCLWNFDPESASDPIPAAVTTADAFSLIGEGSQLIPMNNTVLEWIGTKQMYRLWSFDPQTDAPLQMPVITAGTWSDIDPSHELMALGPFLLDWVPADRSYRLWGFNPFADNPLFGPLKTGTLPEGFGPDCTLTAVEMPVAIGDQADQPGTMDFMRSKIDHVVVYMLESRTFDCMVGWRYAPADPRINWLNAAPPFQGASTAYFNTANGQTWYQYQYANGKPPTGVLNAPTIDPFHGTPDSIFQQWSDGYDGYFAGETPDMGGFVSNNASGTVMVSFTPDQLPVLNGLALDYALSDAWFSALPGGTDSNRAVALTGSAFNVLTTYEGPPQYDVFPTVPHRPSIWKTLWSHGITDWKIYWSVIWMDHIFTYQLYLKGEIPTVDANVDDYVQPIDQFLTDAKNGTLPAFSFLEPAWIAPSGATSYHPGGDMVPAEQQLEKLWEAISTGPGWEKTLFVITFSKGGGVYDHVPPPTATNPWPKDVADGFSHDWLGPRVPTIIASPWVDQNVVFRSPSSVPFSHTTLTATVLEWFGVPRHRWGLGDRVDQAETFESVLTRTSPRTDAHGYTPPGSTED